jgi:hypothetical protein
VLQVATSRGLDLSVNLHVDDATRGGLGGWRNTLNFSPLQKYGGLRWAAAAAAAWQRGCPRQPLCCKMIKHHTASTTDHCLLIGTIFLFLLQLC